MRRKINDMPFSNWHEGEMGRSESPCPFASSRSLLRRRQVRQDWNPVRRAGSPLAVGEGVLLIWPAGEILRAVRIPHRADKDGYDREVLQHLALELVGDRHLSFLGDRLGPLEEERLSACVREVGPVAGCVLS